MLQIPLQKIKPNPENPRIIKDDAFRRLKTSIAQFPEMLEKRGVAVVKDGGKYMAIGGNQRYRALCDLKKEVDDPDFCNLYDATEEKRAVLLGYFANGIPCEDCTNFTPDQVRRFVVLDNAPFGLWDYDELANQYDAEELRKWGVDIPDWGEAVPGGEVQEDDYEIPEPDQIKTDIVPGDLFEIGPHRLLCGDSTIREDVLRLMNGEKADMVFTDPPYGVNVKGGKNKSNIAGDLTQTAIPFSFELCVQVATKPICVFYFCGGEGNIGLYAKLFERFLSQMPRHLIWVKNGFVMKPNGYHNQYEIIFYGYKAGGGGLANWFAGRTEHEASDVWRVNRDSTSTYEHPTQKPIELPARAIRNSCPPGGLVFEPFSGSGSTMAAADGLGKRCFAIEIDPKYCQVTIDRMRKLNPELEIKKNGESYTTP